MTRMDKKIDKAAHCRKTLLNADGADRIFLDSMFGKDLAKKVCEYKYWLETNDPAYQPPRKQARMMFSGIISTLRSIHLGTEVLNEYTNELKDWQKMKST